MVCLWICAGSADYGVAALFDKRAAIRRNALHPRIAALYKTSHFQEVRRTQRDMHGARYTALISVPLRRLCCILFAPYCTGIGVII